MEAKRIYRADVCYVAGWESCIRPFSWRRACRSVLGLWHGSGMVRSSPTECQRGGGRCIFWLLHLPCPCLFDFVVSSLMSVSTVHLPDAHSHCSSAVIHVNPALASFASLSSPLLLLSCHPFLLCIPYSAYKYVDVNYFTDRIFTAFYSVLITTSYLVVRKSRLSYNVPDQMIQNTCVIVAMLCTVCMYFPLAWWSSSVFWARCICGRASALSSESATHKHLALWG